MEEYLVTIAGGLIGLLANIVAAFAGGGSSLIMFPLLLSIAPQSYASILTVAKVGATAGTLTAGKIHFGRNKINKVLLFLVMISSLIGTAIGTYFVQYQLNENLFKIILSATLLVVATFLLFKKKIGVDDGVKDRELNVFAYIVTVVYCVLINILNGLFGGTGIFLTLFFVMFLQLTFIRAVALTVISYVVVNLLQTGYLLSTENVDFALTIAVLIGGGIGAYLGTHLQYLKGNKWVKVAAVSLMYFIGIQNLMVLFY